LIFFDDVKYRIISISYSKRRYAEKWAEKTSQSGIEVLLDDRVYVV